MSSGEVGEVTGRLNWTDVVALPAPAMKDPCPTEQSPWGVTASSLADASPAVGGSTKETTGPKWVTKGGGFIF